MAKGLFGRLQQELDVRAHTAGLTMADILELPHDERQLINWMMRAGDVGLTDVAKQFGQEDAIMQARLGALIEKGFVRETVIHGVNFYQVRMAPRRKRQLPENLWQALDKIIDHKDEG
ncbi:MAG: hypothetical protein NT075_14140 [Chloroflexi bacterium]|nr:hypothetical protein [Chloroflexota bacterium]